MQKEGEHICKLPEIVKTSRSNKYRHLKELYEISTFKKFPHLYEMLGNTTVSKKVLWKSTQSTWC